MKSNDLCGILIETYYNPIYKYCYAVLHCDEQAAKDCTQEIFLIMVRKKAILNLLGNMRVWLYKTADCVMKNYMRKEKRFREQISIDDIEIPDPADAFAPKADSLRAYLSSEEYTLLLAYYDAEHGERSLLAARYGLTVRELYKRIERIKQKLRKAMRTNEA